MKLTLLVALVLATSSCVQGSHDLRIITSRPAVAGNCYQEIDLQVKDGEGSLLASKRFNQGGNVIGLCRHEFLVEIRDSDFYVISLSGFEERTFTREELERAEWTQYFLP